MATAASPPPLPTALLLLPLAAMLTQLVLPPPPAAAIRWLALSQAAAEWRRVAAVANASGAHQTLCARARRSLGLTRRQTRLCRAAPDAFPHVAAAAAAALHTCRALLADRRWDCATADNAPRLGPDLTSGTREQAFVYALASAAVAHSAARACARGALWGCECGAAPRSPPDGLFKWGGCGDNVRWAARFARAFTDAAERRRPLDEDPDPDDEGEGEDDDALRGRRRARGRRGGTEADRRRKKLVALLTAVNQHNNRAGRKAVETSLRRQCKCHGVSGACSVRTCWLALPPSLGAGAGLRLLSAFEAARGAVRGRRVGGARRLLLAPARGQRDLAFVASSPDYCEPDRRTGSLGTHGRQCNASAEAAAARSYDSCGELCCGRGFRAERLQLEERCHCKYVWCCYVRCKSCLRELTVHKCL